MKKISIITASFRSESTIIDTLRSVNLQTYENIEHIIVDGASSDRTLEIVHSEGRRVTKILSEPDSGIYEAFNKGLALANGEIIAFLNSDDFYYAEDTIEKVIKTFEDESVEACYGDLVYVDRNNTKKITRYWKSKPYSAGIFKNAFVPAHPTLFLRKSVYEKAGKFNLTYHIAADYEFMLRIFHLMNINSIYLPEILVKMRAGGASGKSLVSIVWQNKEIFNALEQHSVSFSKANFLLHKIGDRVLQKVRAYGLVVGRLKRFP